MKTNRRILTYALLGLLVLCVVVAYYRTTPDDTAQSKLLSRRRSSDTSLVEQAPLLTARSCARLANHADEEGFAREALRLADRSVNLAFSMALRDAELNPPPQTDRVQHFEQRIDQLQTQLKTDQEIVQGFSAMLANPGTSDAGQLREELEKAKAQQSVTEDELEDARQGLLNAGGDRQTRIQQMHDEYQAMQQDAAATVATKLPPFFVPSNLLAQITTWKNLHGRAAQLQQAAQEAGARIQDLGHKHDQLEASAQQTAPSATHADAMAALHRQALERKTLADYNRRIDAEQKLVQTYNDWSALLSDYQGRVVHAGLLSMLWILLIGFAVIGAEGAVRRFYREGRSDYRKVGAMRMALSFAVQVGGVLAVLLVIFGPPQQLSTFIALAGAGLTVALKDFIVAFFGWFVLIGRNGIRVGDWVEINGIGGEVVELGVLRTVILETGNWNDAGHPTGRKVAFVNSFAIEGHYFNFSTAGQWLWDELNVLVPPGKDPYVISEGVRKLVTEMTADDVTLAEQEWQRANQSNRMKKFSAAPAIETRATGGGIGVVVRYITRANVRYELRSKLNQAIVELLHGRGATAG